MRPQPLAPVLLGPLPSGLRLSALVTSLLSRAGGIRCKYLAGPPWEPYSWTAAVKWESRMQSELNGEQKPSGPLLSFPKHIWNQQRAGARPAAHSAEWTGCLLGDRQELWHKGEVLFTPWEQVLPGTRSPLLPDFPAHVSSEAAPSSTPCSPSPQWRCFWPLPLAACSSQAPGGCHRWPAPAWGRELAGTSSFYISCCWRCQVITTFGSS